MTKLGRHIFRAPSISLAIVLLQAAAGAPGQDAPAREPIVAAEDSISIQALNVEEITGEWRVGATGTLNLPMLGQIQAAGLRVTELEKEIATRLARYVKNPQVTVHIAEHRGQPVVVNGAVPNPGILQLSGPSTLFDVLVRAGGPREAGPNVTLLRKPENGPIALPLATTAPDGRSSIVVLPLADVMKGSGPSAELTVYAHDVITVGEGKRQRLVHIAGEVIKPGAIELVNQDTVPLTKALAMAGGLSRTAAAKKAMIRHVNERGIETASGFVDIPRILSGKAKDLELADGDILIVPSSNVLAYVTSASGLAVNARFLLLGRF
ncbi:MAG: polysaccharide biosynthesis/export family protein [Bryobacteraceae bacterium]